MRAGGPICHKILFGGRFVLFLGMGRKKRSRGRKSRSRGRKSNSRSRDRKSMSRGKE